MGRFQRQADGIKQDLCADIGGSAFMSACAAAPALKRCARRGQRATQMTCTSKSPPKRAALRRRIRVTGCGGELSGQTPRDLSA